MNTYLHFQVHHLQHLRNVQYYSHVQYYNVFAIGTTTVCTRTEMMVLLDSWSGFLIRIKILTKINNLESHFSVNLISVYCELSLGTLNKSNFKLIIIVYAIPIPRPHHILIIT